MSGTPSLVAPDLGPSCRRRWKSMSAPSGSPFATSRNSFSIAGSGGGIAGGPFQASGGSPETPRTGGRSSPNRRWMSVFPDEMRDCPPPLA